MIMMIMGWEHSGGKKMENKNNKNKNRRHMMNGGAWPTATFKAFSGSYSWLQIKKILYIQS